jgi:ribosomal protein S18 acetylase RimI-like enzyme
MLEGLPKNKDDYIVRSYEEGDEIQLTRLFNSVYQTYGGFVPKTPEYWRWCCLDRPDVEKKRIIIVVCGEKIVGYAVVGKSGNIWEFCFDHAYDGKKIASLILGEAIEYLENFGAESATLNVPFEDLLAKEVCQRFGFVEVPSERLYLGVLDFERFLQLLVSAKKEKLKGFNDEVLITFRNAPFWIDPHISVKVENWNTQIEEVNKRHKVLIETDIETFTSILFGTAKPLWAWLRFRLKIHPLRKVRDALKLLSSLSLNNPWFFPGSDFG